MEYTVVLTRGELADIVERFSRADAFAFDVETVGDHRGDPIRNHVLWLSLADADCTAVIPMGHPNGDLLRWDYPLLKSGMERVAQGKMLRKSDFSRDRRKAVPVFTDPPEQLDRSEVMDALIPVFASDALKIGHNVKFDINSLYKYLPVEGPFWDTRTVDWVLDSSLYGRLKLQDCVKRRLDIDLDKGVGERVERHSFDEVSDYSAMDARVTYDLYEAQVKDLDVVTERIVGLEMLVLEVLARMERTGVRLDSERLKEFAREAEQEVERCVAAAYRAAKTRFNINSNADKQRLLFSPRPEGQGLKGRVLTESGRARQEAGELPSPYDYSTGAEALSGLKNPLVVALRDYQKWMKLQSTYIRPYLGGETVRTVNGKSRTEWVDSALVNGRIHTRFVQDRVETGRLSSREPNLQNVPARSAEGKKIRNLFVASEGMVLVQADFSQIEPRIIADLSGDPTLTATYMDGGDVYQAVADRLGVDRGVGKTLVLAIAYGIGAQSIADRTGMSKTKARELMDYFNRSFPRIGVHKRNVLAAVRKERPYASSTVLGRKRYLPHINVPDDMLRAQAERRAYNHVVQGSASDVMKVALVMVSEALPDTARILLTVHDELVLEAERGSAQEVEEILKTQMERAGKPWFKIPLVAETTIAESWGECK